MPLLARFAFHHFRFQGLYVRSSLQHTDFFARLCVVEPSGKSINICDGIVRLTPGYAVPQADG